MPTGYTAALYEGEQTAQDFLLRLARGMGFAVTMRDEPADKPLPEKFTPAQYYIEAVEEAKAGHAALLAQTPEQIEAQCSKAYADALDYYESELQRRAGIKARYEQMLAQIRGWQPTHEATIGLKRFALEQLELSQSDYSTDWLKAPEQVTPEEYFDREMKSALRKLERAAKDLVEENERVRRRNEALAALRAELPALKAEAI